MNNVDDILEHFGTVGMKWGIRRGKKVTGVSRSRGALLDFNQVRRTQMELIRDNKGTYKVYGKMGEAFYGNQKFAGRLNKSIRKMDEQDQRLLSSGKLLTKDKLAIYGVLRYSNYLDLVISRQLVKKAPRPPKRKLNKLEVEMLARSKVGEVLDLKALRKAAREELNMSTDSVDNFLEHFGTKGMKWGVRRADKKWERKNTRTAKTVTSIYNESIAGANHDIKTIVNKKYVGKVMSDPSVKLQYQRDVVSALNKHLAENSLKRTSPSGNKKLWAGITEEGKLWIQAIDKNAKHADDGNKIFLDVKRDFNGFITEISLPDEATMTTVPTRERTMDTEIIFQHQQEVDDFLEHFGTKGMQWGVRKAKARVARAKEHHKLVKADRPDSKLFGPKRAKGRTVFKTAPKHLTDEELNARIRRMELEKKYNELNKRDLTKGQSASKEILSGAGKNAAKKTANAVAVFAVKKAIQKASKKHGVDITKEFSKNK